LAPALLSGADAIWRDCAKWRAAGPRKADGAERRGSAVSLYRFLSDGLDSAMAAKAAPNERKMIVIVRGDDAGEPPHHGGAWKVAYADFMTALMAFFLLMWLLNATTEEQRKGLADYFSPTNLFGHTLSGSGQPFGGHTPNDAGSMISDRGAQQVIPGKAAIQLDVEEDDTDTPAQAQQHRDGGASPAPSRARRDHPLMRQPAQTDGLRADPQLTPTPNAPTPNAPTPVALTPAAAAREMAARAAAAREDHVLQAAAAQMREAVQQDPSLREIAKQLVIEQIPEGLRLQLLDGERGSMFALGSAVANDRARLLVQKLAPVLGKLTNALSISGHTDSALFPSPDKTNWELSAERANATRRLLVEDGVPESRIRSVTGNADRDLLVPGDPLAAANRRVAIVVLRNTPPDPSPNVTGAAP
jgi:chemotaxis protein MotB